MLALQLAVEKEDGGQLHQVAEAEVDHVQGADPVQGKGALAVGKDGRPQQQKQQQPVGGVGGGTMLWPMIALSNIAQGSAVLGMIYLQRKNAAAQEVNVPSCISCYLGVTEPAMFGVNLKYNFPFICGMIGSAVAGVVCTATSTTANSVGVGGLPGILSIQPASMLSFALCMVIAIVIPFVLTVVMGKKKGVA